MFPRQLNLSKNHSFFLFGARGTGKSSLLKSYFNANKSITVDLLNPELCDKLSAYPNKLLDIITDLKSEDSWVIIDEIQKVPKLLDIVHSLLSDKKFNFALTGSSARKLKRGAANLLAGRAFVFTLFPLTHQELGDSFKLQQAIEYGTLPECWQLTDELDRRRFLKSYATTYLREEIIEEQIVRNLPPFRRFLEAAAICNTDLVNYSNIAKDISSDPKTVKGYYEILEDTLLGFSLPSFHHSIRKRQKGAPKFYFFDTGVTRSLAAKIDYPVAPKSYEYGQLFESFIVNEIYRALNYEEKQFSLSYIRVDEKLEIDLVIERAGLPVFLCEIKSTDNTDQRHAKSLEILGKSFDGAAKLLIANDPIRKNFNGITALHWKEAIKVIVAGSL